MKVLILIPKETYNTCKFPGGGGGVRISGPPTSLRIHNSEIKAVKAKNKPCVSDDPVRQPPTKNLFPDILEIADFRAFRSIQYVSITDTTPVAITTVMRTVTDQCSR